MDNKILNKNIIWILVILGLSLIFFSVVWPQRQTVQEIPLSQVVQMAQEGKIQSIEVTGDEITVITKDSVSLKAYKETSDSMTQILTEQGIVIGSEGIQLTIQPEESSIWMQLLIYVVPFLIMGFFIFYMFRGARGAGNQVFNFSRSKARMFSGSKSSVTFADVAGVDEAKQELQEVVEFLKQPGKFVALGARIPRGVLLVGPPGIGKTLLAKAVAGEAGVPFFSISGSEFVEMFVGVGASRVRDLFEQAKRSAPAIIFVDEIDAVGRHRGSGLGGSHDEREQTLNQILVEMDGFDSSTNVIVMAATNRPDILDPALLRPGRFDRRVVLDLPDITGRKQILAVHAKGKPLENEADLETIAKETTGFSGADLANVLNEAAILAARRNKKKIGISELSEAVDRIIAGPERRSRKISTKEKDITAYHEAGHALVAHMLPNADPVHKITIVSRGMALGYTMQLPTEDRYLTSRSQFKDKIAVLLAGRVAEDLQFNEFTNGSAHDLQMATNIVHKMVTEYGMSEGLGPRIFGHKEDMIVLGRDIATQRDYGDKVADAIDEEVKKMIEDAENTARDILTNNKEKLIQIANYLIANETVEGEQLEKLLGGQAPVSQPEIIPGSPELGAQPAS